MQNFEARLDALRKELDFLESAGYQVMLGWRPPLIFEDSPICPKPPYAACPDDRCLLLDFIPENQRDQKVPCRHIPLNEMGETLHTLYNTANMDEIENTLREWLKKEIEKLQSKIASQAIPQIAA
jgi:hypothetical protein